MKKRTSVGERGHRWTEFETRLFNIVGIGCYEATTNRDEHIIFSERLSITDILLEAFDRYVAGRNEYKSKTGSL